ncbi:MAG: electron transfer flavoprotein subunit alpha/FixB family protein [Prolixibacteraceae bacterium]|jgi:electron transfer flavoprotein alpha subunit|nr:electron transfer flavoprotein subunit alpha/FixB family protein [Prolixibacteraceae bacterium]MBT6767170.1 electron transfer flavoprotein subunit alpha/FixB family protein [Prolixibacteraceae bacterium]MBT6998851.1 electron transfer flavoprotein subunit alpha/FixB family protein [Prolixibacteraceae bacterium]MBT7395104.1 electron transfer flavoprotein subunit alpha/FixB family protein [Prolixibacteraceae bacterium]
MSVLVYTENWDGVFKKLSFELVSYATKVAEMIGTSVTAVSIGDVADDELNRLGTFGALKVIKVEGNTNLDNQVYTSILAEVAKAEDAKVVVISHNNTGKAIAPRLSVKLNAAVGAGLIKLPVSTNPFTVSKKVFSGKAKANVVLKTDVKILTLSQNSFEVIEKGGAATIETFAADVSDAKTVVKDVQKQTGKILLNDAEMVVSGGRGLKSADNWGVIEDLAEVLGAGTACSRPVSDEGWRPHEEHTGQTGKIIAPNLYIAAGISGAIQHMAGISSSKCIVAINNDADAPVFESSDYGIVGDAMKVLPALAEAIKEAKNK